MLKGDIIHNSNELELITKKINVNNQKLILNLLYKASEDSDKAEAFHSKCDQAKSTIVLIETNKGKRFGGFTSCSRKADCFSKKDECAFIFSLDKMKFFMLYLEKRQLVVIQNMDRFSLDVKLEFLMMIL